MNNFKIENGVPMPDRYNRGSIASLLRSMEVGDSCVIPRRSSNLHSCAKRVGMKVATRKVSETEVRIWRTA